MSRWLRADPETHDWIVSLLVLAGAYVAALVISLGVGSLAVGLAAQDTLANMFAGFTLMLDRPFRIGDRIALSSGEMGDVDAIGIRATRIRTLDQTSVLHEEIYRRLADAGIEIPYPVRRLVGPSPAPAGAGEV